MTSDHLLPPNATALERSLSLSTDLLTRLGGETEPLKGFKTDPSDSLLPWLIGQLQQPGIHKVELSEPATDIRIHSTQAVRLTDVQLTFAGRDR